MLQKYIGDLTDAITDPVALATDLSVSELISDITCQKINNDSSNQKARNYHILNELMTRVATDPTNLTKITSVLQRHGPQDSAIAEKMITGKTPTMSTLHIIIWSL